MTKHRKPRPNVPNSAAPSNFNPGDALERLYTELVEVEALAQAAGEAVTQLPSASSRATRRCFARLYALVTRTANEATAALTLSESLVAALSAHMAGQRRALELERSP